MKTLLSLTLPVMALGALAMNLHSQTPAAPAVLPTPTAPLQVLQAMKAKNQELLEKQAQTLQKLDELAKEAEQLKIFAKRS